MDIEVSAYRAAQILNKDVATVKTLIDEGIIPGRIQNFSKDPRSKRYYVKLSTLESYKHKD